MKPSVCKYLCKLFLILMDIIKEMKPEQEIVSSSKSSNECFVYFTYLCTLYIFLHFQILNKCIKVRSQIVICVILYVSYCIEEHIDVVELSSKQRRNYFPVNRVSYTFRRPFLRKSMQRALELKKSNERISLAHCKILQCLDIFAGSTHLAYPQCLQSVFSGTLTFHTAF